MDQPGVPTAKQHASLSPAKMAKKHPSPDRQYSGTRPRNPRSLLRAASLKTCRCLQGVAATYCFLQPDENGVPTSELDEHGPSAKSVVEHRILDRLSFRRRTGSSRQGAEDLFNQIGPSWRNRCSGRLTSPTTRLPDSQIMRDTRLLCEERSGTWSTHVGNVERWW